MKFDRTGRFGPLPPPLTPAEGLSELRYYIALAERDHTLSSVAMAVAAYRQIHLLAEALPAEASTDLIDTADDALPTWWCY